MRTKRLQIENCKLQIANCRRRRPCKFSIFNSSSTKRGFTLFEVLLALAIFAVSLAAIGQMMSNGLRGAVQARLQSQAVLRCQAKLAEAELKIQQLEKAASGEMKLKPVEKDIET